MTFSLVDLSGAEVGKGMQREASKTTIQGGYNITRSRDN